MVQGKTKGLQAKAAPRSSSHAAQPKKGRRAIPPKKQAAVKHAAIQKSLSSKINRAVEQQIAHTASSSGKLVIVKDDHPPAKR